MQQLDSWGGFGEALGTSPWQVRGLVLQAGLRFAKQRVPGGTKAVFERLPPAAQPYFKQQLAALSWYDAFAPAVYHRSVAERLALSLTEQAIAFGAFTCREDLSGGPHAMLLKIFKPRHIGLYMPKVAGFFLRAYAKLTTHERSAGQVDVRLDGMPTHPGLFLLHLSMSYAAELVRMTGGKDASFTVERVEPDGRDTVRADVLLRWSE